MKKSCLNFDRQIRQIEQCVLVQPNVGNPLCRVPKVNSEENGRIHGTGEILRSVF